MQDSSRPPLCQASPFLSEAYLHQHMQEITQPPVFVQATTIYPNRKQLMWRTILIVATLFFSLACLLLFFVFNFISHKSLIDSDGVLPLLIMLAGITFLAWFAWIFIAYFRTPYMPILTINHEGIIVGKVFAFSSFFLSWADIESMYVYRSYYNYLCIKPKRKKEFLERFSPIEHFFRNFNRRVAAPIIIAEIFLEEPVEILLQRLYNGYNHELMYYNVKILL